MKTLCLLLALSLCQLLDAQSKKQPKLLSKEINAQTFEKKINEKFSKSIQAFKNCYLKSDGVIYEDKIPSTKHVYDTLIPANATITLTVNGSLPLRQRYVLLTYGNGNGLTLVANTKSKYYDGRSESRFSYSEGFVFSNISQEAYKKCLNEDYIDTSIYFLEREWLGSVNRLTISNNTNQGKYIKLLYFQDKAEISSIATQEYQNRKKAGADVNSGTTTVTKKTEGTNTKTTETAKKKKLVCGACNGKINIRVSCDVNGCVNGVTGYKTVTEKRQEGPYMRTITKKVPIACWKCNGTGYIYYTCKRCNGTGYVD